VHLCGERASIGLVRERRVAERWRVGATRGVLHSAACVACWTEDVEAHYLASCGVRCCGSGRLHVVSWDAVVSACGEHTCA